MTQRQRESYRNLLKELDEKKDNQVKRLLQSALQLDEKGEFWKFIQAFGTPYALQGDEIQYKY